MVSIWHWRCAVCDATATTAWPAAWQARGTMLPAGWVALPGSEIGVQCGTCAGRQLSLFAPVDAGRQRP